MSSPQKSRKLYMMGLVLLVMMLLFDLVGTSAWSFQFPSLKKEKSSQDAFAVYKEKRPEPGFEPTGITDVDTLGLSVSTLYEGALKELDDYMVECEHNKTYQAYVNDVNTCQKDAKTDAAKEECAAEIYSKATSEQKAEIDAFRKANEAKVQNTLTQFVGLAGMSASVYSIAQKGTSFFSELGFNAFAAIQSVGKMKNQMDYLVKTKQFFYQQKSIMHQLNTYEGK